MNSNFVFGNLLALGKKIMTFDLVMNSNFVFGNLLALGKKIMTFDIVKKIMNSAISGGLYYGFLTTFAIGPAFFFHIQAQVMEEGEEGTEVIEKKVAAINGFIIGQLIMFISIYYTPLHLALGRPHTLTFLIIPYFLCHFFWTNHKSFFDFGSTSRDSMRNSWIRNLRIQCVFINNIIIQLFNNFLFPSPILARLVTIYMFRCNAKMLFLVSSFFSWLIGQVFFMKALDFLILWIRQNRITVRFYRSKMYTRSKAFLSNKWNYSTSRICTIIIYSICGFYLGSMPVPLFTYKVNQNAEWTFRRYQIAQMKKRGNETEQEEEGFSQVDPSPSDVKFQILKPLKEDKDIFFFEKAPASLIFDYRRWNDPTRYIENEVINEMTQFFFYTVGNDGQKRIRFTFPPGLKMFWDMMQRKIAFFTKTKVDPSPSDIKFQTLKAPKFFFEKAPSSLISEGKFEIKKAKPLRIRKDPFIEDKTRYTPITIANYTVFVTVEPLIQLVCNQIKKQVVLLTRKIFLYWKKQKQIRLLKNQKKEYLKEIAILQQEILKYESKIHETDQDLEKLVQSKKKKK